MKNTTTLLVAFVFYSLHISSMHLKDAITAKKIAVEVSGANYDSVPESIRTSADHPNMQMSVSNLTNGPLNLDLEPGYMLESAEPGYQAMLVTQSIALNLRPHERQLSFMHAMCTQLHNSGPNSSLHYHVADKAKPALLQVAQFIASRNYLGYAAQDAVWSISDDMPIPSIGDDKNPIDNELQQLVANIKGVDLQKIKDEYKKNAKAAIAEFIGSKVDRNIPFEVKDSAKVAVGYYDIGGEQIKPIVKETLMKEGKHSVRYDPYPVALVGRRYSVKMYKDGSLYREYYFRQ